MATVKYTIEFEATETLWPHTETIEGDGTVKTVNKEITRSYINTGSVKITRNDEPMSLVNYENSEKAPYFSAGMKATEE